MRKLLRLVVVLAILLLVAAAAVFFYIDVIAKKGIEGGATHALGVPTTLNKADVGVFAGRFDMTGLKVANPDGFKTPHLLNLDTGGVSVTLGSLTKDIIELPELTMTGLDVNLENQAGKSNYKIILDNLKKTEGEPKPADPKAESGKRFIVRKIDIRDVNVHVDLLPVGGELSRTHIPIKEITLTDVGSDTGKGVLLKDLSGVIIKAIFAAIIANGADLPKDIAADLGGALSQLKGLGDIGVKVGGQTVQDLGKAVEQLGGGAGEALKGITDGTGDVGKKVGEEAEKALKGLGGILGGNKKQE